MRLYLAGITIVARVVAAWSVGELSDHQAAFAFAVFLAGTVGLHLAVPIVGGAAFVLARQTGHLDVQPVQVTAELSVWAAAGVALVLAMGRWPWAIPWVMFAASVLLWRDTIMILSGVDPAPIVADRIQEII